VANPGYLAEFVWERRLDLFGPTNQARGYPTAYLKRATQHSTTTSRDTPRIETTPIYHIRTQDFGSLCLTRTSSVKRLVLRYDSLDGDARYLAPGRQSILILPVITDRNKYTTLRSLEYRYRDIGAESIYGVMLLSLCESHCVAFITVFCPVIQYKPTSEHHERHQHVSYREYCTRSFCGSYFSCCRGLAAVYALSTLVSELV
jgi:hypothetical protein